ncbi:MAG TPA: hypothetical protein H9968_03030 [Candidatus Anaerobutyricum stercoris]|uniref:Uncharacterized protein n=1 Tax=Candidatus Anaerobutyricum stercoris TaxID=2838457 RepID=A0A9D2J6Y6_9FIRM|nr:hypothetical protein [Candidatus Anaerobutyricum stercoris]
MAPFENITEDGFSLLQQILEHPNTTQGDFFFTEPTVDGQIKILETAGLVRANSEHKLYVTELGRAAIKHHLHEQQQLTLVQQQRQQELESLQTIAESAKKQAELAAAQAENAEKEAKIARRDARFAKVVSVLAIAIPILWDVLKPYLPIISQQISELLSAN